MWFYLRFPNLWIYLLYFYIHDTFPIYLKFQLRVRYEKKKVLRDEILNPYLITCSVFGKKRVSQI